MIKTITVTNHLGEELCLELARPEKSGFVVASVTGLGPVKSGVNTTKLARSHGVRYNSSYLDQRDIVMNLLFLDDATNSIEDRRHQTYKYFPENTEITLSIETDRRKVKTKCYVEHNEPDIFSDSEGCSITLIAPDPYLYALKSTSVAFNIVEPAFEFPFPDETDEEPAHELGIINDIFTHGIHYDGDCDVGTNIRIYISGNVINPTIYNHMTGEKMCINTSLLSKLMGTEHGFIANDIIDITTHHMNKTITLLRQGGRINILNCLDKNTEWITLTRGNNQITCLADEDDGGNPTVNRMSVYITYNVAYGGI